MLVLNDVGQTFLKDLENPVSIFFHPFWYASFVVVFSCQLEVTCLYARPEHCQLRLENLKTWSVQTGNLSGDNVVLGTKRSSEDLYLIRQ